MISSELAEAEKLLEASERCIDEKRHEQIMALVKSIINPLVEKRVPRALWLKARLPNLGEEKPLDVEEFDKMWLELIVESAEGGCAEALYSVGCNLYEVGEKEKAVNLYKRSAEAGYSNGQWCYGIDTLNGIGTKADNVLGMHYIYCAAEQRCEFAVNFLLECNRKKLHGVNFSELELNKWSSILAGIQDV